MKDALYDFGLDRTDNETTDGSRFMSSIIIAPIKNSIPINERTDHPTQKPLELISKLIKAFSFEGDLVVDPFVGSGTTAEACIKLKRRFIAIEKDKRFFDIACNRIEKALQQQTIF